MRRGFSELRAGKDIFIAIAHTVYLLYTGTHSLVQASRSFAVDFLEIESGTVGCGKR